MTTLPSWIVILQALLTPTIAAVAGLVAFLQWRTAHQKVMLDLFDRRIQVYEEVNAAVIYAITEHGKFVSFNATRRLSKSWGDSRFLFGKEVSDAILVVIDDVAKYGHNLRHLERNNINPDQKYKTAEIIEELEKKLEEFREPFTALCLPYIHMNQKRVRTPGEWFHDKNSERLSYADEKQR
ncbi:hypothetical protein K1X45_13390 [Pseudochrobactrum sp. Wa41.01b-1]|uniref:hypothetical protein n=1 Tax=Pseudochrobactrum sp. Wa41.01b-1 TaxID=2864102 RepID=UPI001C69258A|nr:hypothetical protein [Pseudochrobactrum sp. Wa41.01b-1]QYM72455.1 hypothetical protein K1X45_13390 [Pseudochrobactrum sp. Wa41.01b-1]